MIQQVIKTKSFQFGVDSYRACAAIMKDKNEWVLTRQLMRSSTAIGALCAESDYAQSKLDFIHKRSIARKECNESKYWIAMMKELGLMDEPSAKRLGIQAEELMRLLTSGIRTAQQNLKTK
jgi:four helix bundle protein